MKSSEQKASSSSNHLESKDVNPFFSKVRGGAFGQEQTKATPFFAGNKPIQTKLKVHPSDDQHEKEADTAADHVVEHLHAPHSVQKQENDEEAAIQTMRIGNGISSLQTQRAFESPSAMEKNSASNGEQEMALQTKRESTADETGEGLESQLSESKGTGSNLPEDTRSKMESGLGADFSNVHVHNDNKSAQLNQQLGSRAFTHGNDIYFNDGEYKPATKSGDHLIAHELTHTMQQGAAKTGGVQRKQTGTPFTKSVIPSAPEALQQKKAGSEAACLQMKSSSAMPADAGNSHGSLPPANPQKRFAMYSIQRKGGINDVIAKTFEDDKLGKINTDPKEITIPSIKVPDFKKTVTGQKNKIILPKAERTDKQRDLWDKEVKEKFPENLLTNKISSTGSPGITTSDGQKIYAFKTLHQSGGLDSYVIGDLATVKARVGRPGWDKNGNQESFHVDHQHEFQLGGADEDINNMWLLQAQANTSSGSNIKTEKDKTITDLVTAASKPGPKQVWEKQPKTETVKNQYTIEFKTAVGGLPVSGKPGVNYKMPDIVAGESLKGLKVLDKHEIDKMGLSRDDVLNLFTRKDGGKMYKIDNWNKAEGEKTVHLGLGANLDITKITFSSETGGKVKGRLFENAEKVKKYLKKSVYEFDIKPMTGVPHSAYIDNPSMRKELKEKLEANAMSPVDVVDADLDQKGLVVRGKIMPSIPIIEKAGIDLVLDGDNIYLEKVFSTGEFKVPAPFKISDSSLAIRAGTNGVEFAGEVDFGIDRVGEGSVKAYVNTNQEFGVKGSFEFDKKLFDNAKVEVAYEKQQWSVKGTIEIPKKKIKGIKKASATIAYTEGTLSAAGTVEPDIKGVKEGSFELKYSQEQFMISGKLQLSPEIPRLKKGEINVTVEGGSEGGYKLKGSGLAEFDFPGINTGLNVQYDDGLLTIEATVNFEKGLAKGELKAGVTNRPVDAQGNPQGEPGDKWTIYGGGTLTVRITPWLAATAGVHFLPNGEMEVLGRIELPSTVDVFGQKSFEKTLFSLPTIEIPLFAIPLGPKSVGLVAQIRGGLDFKASIGPGQLRGLFGQIQYNPSRPEETTLSGGGSFVIPAEAGLNLHASLGLGVSVGFASLTGGIELVAGVGLKGEASAGINLSWNPTSGLELNAEGKVVVQPKFKFDVNLFARASLDLFLFELSKEWRYNLASFEWGPGFEFGLIFPIHYKEGQPFNISFNDVQVIKPDIDIMGTVKGIANKVKDEVF
jgi:hypothetical protein